MLAIPLILALTIATTHADIELDAKCYFSRLDTYSELENSWPIQIAISYLTNFIYLVDINLRTWRKRLTVHKEDENSQKIFEEINLGRAIVNTVAVDTFPSSHRIYIGCDTGLKVYEELSGKLTDVPGVTKHITYLFMSRRDLRIYAIIWPENDVYEYIYKEEVGEKQNITTIQMSSGAFVIDLEGNFFYQGQEVKKNVKGHITYSRSVKSNETMKYDFTVLDLAVDKQGRVFGTYKDSLYRLRKDSITPIYVTNLTAGLSSMCFDENNNLIFGAKGLYRLKYDYKCYSFTNTSEDAGKCYYKELINDSILWATQIAVSHLSGTIYIAVQSLEDAVYRIEKGGPELTKIELLHKNLYHINTVAMDNLAGKLYIGYEAGIQIYDEISGEMEMLKQFSEEVFQVIVKPGTSETYIQTFTHLGVYKYVSLSEGALQLVGENLNFNRPVRSFVTDAVQNIYYQSQISPHTSRTESLKRDVSNPIRYDHDLKMAVDKRGLVFATTNSTLYHLNPANNTLHLIARIAINFLTMYFDNQNDLIFVTPDKIVRYKLSSGKEKCDMVG